MLKSVKSQITAAIALLVIVLLSATAYFVLSQKIKEIDHDIYDKALSFSELTNERIVRNYEQNYKEQAYAHFDREMADIYALNTDIKGVSIYNFQGEALVQAKGFELEKLEADDFERVQQVIPSLKIQGSGRILYIEKTDNEIRFTDSNGRAVEPLGDFEQIQDIIYPFRDQNNAQRAFVLRYFVSYDSLASRVQATTINIVMVALIGMVLAIALGGIVAGKITSPIKSLTQGATKIGSGDFKARVEIKSRSEVGMLADTFNKMAADLEISTQAKIEKEKLSRELELAGEIQRELLPQVLPNLENLDLAAGLISAEEVGGDCYDFVCQGGGNCLFYIADVTGHGVPAGLVAAINNALVPAYSESIHDIKELMIHLNAMLKQKMRPNVFMTMVMGHWDSKTMELSYTQAGHDPILHYKSSGDQVEELKHGGMALGMIPDVSKIMKTEKTKGAPGDVFVLYTDGIPEAWTNEKENLGMDRFKEIIKKNAKLKTAQDIYNAILADVKQFMGSYPQADDITLLVLKVRD
jgi:serine phosphatase RsbU (regulator of sigma subunit)